MAQATKMNILDGALTLAWPGEVASLQGLVLASKHAFNVYMNTTETLIRTCTSVFSITNIWIYICYI